MGVMRLDLTEEIEKDWLSVVYYGNFGVELHEWFSHNIKGNWSMYGAEGFRILELYFSEQQEALLFKLTWG